MRAYIHAVATTAESPRHASRGPATCTAQAVVVRHPGCTSPPACAADYRSSSPAHVHPAGWVEMASGYSTGICIENKIGQNRTQSHAQNHSHREQDTMDRTESDGIGQNHTHRTEPFTQTEHHRQNRIGQTNRMNRLGKDRSQSHGQNRIGQNNRIGRTEHTHTNRMHHGTHTHMITRRVPQEEALIMYEEGTCTNALSSSTKGGRARTPCRRRLSTGEQT